MCEPTTACRRFAVDDYCDRCDLLVGLDGYHVAGVERADTGLVVTVESPPVPVGCPAGGAVGVSHGRRVVTVIDVPCFGRPVRLRWRKRTWSCSGRGRGCEVGVFTEQDPTLARPRGLLSTRACWWAIGQLRREHASVAGLARQLGCSWRTVWTSIRPLLQAMDVDPARFNGVSRLGVDEHIWHHTSVQARGPKELTGMVDLSPDKDGNTKARLLDLVPGRSGKAYADWLSERGEQFRKNVKIATLDPFHGYKNAIDDQLADATAVMDAFHVVRVRHEALCVSSGGERPPPLGCRSSLVKLRAA